ncbi:DNA-binding MarR family transcriptional regulator [Saccharothrix ecbatanensis]|jgi:DNA-binding MarR family transcriptional regulator|uniref:DNA-binding MarR family transcriptional regulator n=1 Tax=Saccharothrix ecbatanensis TaxID=1105145 RepID=A0A7W9HHT3_9PSEU|nr:MarR family transcriptional regulator [Saccharothrix ecbatanensis]MBB5802415.1 DNA-binding MarR family transcriptional regulator [Saccharothrix ecbatanensis]
MSSISSGSARDRRRTVTAIKEALRDLRNQLSLLNHQVGRRLELKDVDLDCLELILKHGAMTPGELARRAGLHPATLTGILDRLQKGGWVTRERDPQAADRRAVTVRPVKDRNAELFGLYSGMNSAMDGLFEGYSEDELALLADFLRRTTALGRTATEELSAD